MQIKVYCDHHLQSKAAADQIAELLLWNSSALLCFATGDTPKLTYELLVERLMNEKIDISKCFFIGLDEWVAVSKDDTGSCHWFLHHYLFEPLNIPASQIHLFDANAEDLQAECRKMNDLIRYKNGIDLMLVGVGMNGHIGFNEPGTKEDGLAHVIDLDATTLSVSKKYFNGEMQASKGITLGLGQFLSAREVIMMASGSKKAPIMKMALEGETGTQVPASLVRNHRNASVVLDKEAAEGLQLISQNLFQ